MGTIPKFSKLIKHLEEHIHRATVILPVVLLIISIFANISLQNEINTAFSAEGGNVGGPGEVASGGALGSDATLVSRGVPDDYSVVSMGEDEDPGSFIIEDSAFLNTGNPQSSVLVHRDGLIIYKVQKGDTLSSIAANFGISLNTIYWANKGVKGVSLKIGQEITILPVSGIIYQVASGETLDSIASTFSIPESRILKYNPKVLSQGLSTGVSLIIPDVKPIATAVTTSKLPDFAGYYAIPTTGWNWGKLHNFNAVDIANACGTPIYAAAEGLVAEAKTGGWNEGYGGYIVIEHPNNTKTRYSHNSKNVVSIGDYVLQGDTIAYIGNTGNVHGPTGCHLHFEVIGARNPFAK